MGGDVTPGAPGGGRAGPAADTSRPGNSPQSGESKWQPAGEAAHRRRQMLRVHSLTTRRVNRRIFELANDSTLNTSTKPSAIKTCIKSCAVAARSPLRARLSRVGAGRCQRAYRGQPAGADAAASRRGRPAAGSARPRSQTSPTDWRAAAPTCRCDGAAEPATLSAGAPVRTTHTGCWGTLRTRAGRNALKETLRVRCDVLFHVPKAPTQPVESGRRQLARSHVARTGTRRDGVVDPRQSISASELTVFACSRVIGALDSNASELD